MELISDQQQSVAPTPSRDLPHTLALLVVADLIVTRSANEVEK
jgi:hypothetical protein